MKQQSTRTNSGPKMASNGGSGGNNYPPPPPLTMMHQHDALKAIGELEECDAKDILIKMVSYLNP